MRLFLALAVSAVACARTLPPYGTVVVFVDTDAAVPQLVGHLRIEVMRASDLTVLQTLDIARPDPHDWPVSFGVYDPDNIAERDALLRFRAFPEGRLDNDVPQVPVTIDRLARVHLTPGVVSSVRVTLRGECFGTAADLSARTTCVDTAGASVPVPLAGDGPASVIGSFGKSACTATPRAPSALFDDEVCVAGGAFMFGNVYEVTHSELANGLPEHTFVVPPLLVDRYEVTVGRFRAALANGFQPPLAFSVNNGPITTSNAYTFSDVPMGRESYPMSGVPYPTARAFCQWAGGDLPTEVEWEYIAQAAGRAFKTRFAWGDDAPDCDRAIINRQLPPDDACISKARPLGPASEDAAPDDASITYAIMQLDGNLNEFMRDGHAPLGSQCWMNAPLHDPWCDDDKLPRSIRGGSWKGAETLGTRGLEGPPPDKIFYTAPEVGFRCVRPGVP